jgi:hypothetical protein
VKPYVGQMVIALIDPDTNNGTNVCPALINRVWPQVEGQTQIVNMTVFPDQCGAQSWGSVGLYETQEDAEAGQEPQRAFWMPPPAA